MTAVSKGTADKVRFGRAVSSAIAVQGKEVSDKFEDWFFAGEKPRKLSIAETLERLGAKLDADTDAFERADLAHQVEQLDDVEPRSRRDAAVLELRETLIAASDIVRGAYGIGVSQQVGLEAPLLDRADLLLSQARGIEARLGSPPKVQPKRGGRGVSFADVRAGIREAADALEAGLGDVRREDREAQQTFSTREAADREWGSTYMTAGDVFASMCRAAGLVELADRVRPTARRRAGIEDGAEPGVGPVVDPSAPAPVSPTPER